ncbi:MAG: ROK family transcriptional regulator [Ignavibacteria bacterium]|nr:ROK family transcriptional regulator [Ignavibacteria bacterium]
MKTENVISGNSKVVRNINRSMILNIIRNKQPLSRTKIARMTRLNKSTVSSIVAELINEELVFEQKTSDPNVGRNPLDLSLKLGKYFVGAISIDAALTRFAIADIDGSVLGTSSIDSEPKKPVEFLERCRTELDMLCEQLNIKNLEGLGFSIAGIVDSKNLIVNFAPNLGWEDFDIGKVIKELWPNIGILAVGNDAKCSAMAELWFGTHKLNLSNFVFLQIGPGIGSGIVVENKILDGELHASGEVGHMVLYEGGELCICGNHGCWERYASDRATVKRYIARKNGLLDNPTNLKIDDIIEAAKNNDGIAREVLTQTGYYLGLGIANIIKFIDPHVIIVGGRIIQAWDFVYPEINDVVKKRAFYGKRRVISILPTSLQIRPRLLGAATLAIKVIFDDYKIMF